MAASPQLDQVVRLVTTWVQDVQTRGTIEGIRTAYDELASNFPVAADISTERVAIGDINGEWIAAPGVADDGALLFLHGGGYIMGSPRTHRALMSRLSRAAGVRTLGVDYRLAPEHPFPAAFEDAVAAYRWLLSNGVPPEKIVIAGDSCGGGLTVATLVALRAAGDLLPAAGVCISAWTDLAQTGDSLTANAPIDPFLQREALELMAGLYMGAQDRCSPDASPLYSDLRGLPPLLLLVGSTETLLDDSRRLAARANVAGVDATLEVWDDMIHVWPLFAPMLPEGQRAIDRIGAFIRERTHSTST